MRGVHVLVAEHPSVAAPVLALGPTGQGRVQPERLVDDGVEVGHVDVILGVERIGLWRVVLVYLCLKTLVHLRMPKKAEERGGESTGSRIGTGDHREDRIGHHFAERRRRGGFNSGLVILRCTTLDCGERCR